MQQFPRKGAWMRFSRSLFACAVVTFIVCATSAPAMAAVPHTVQPGETLWSIAAANGFTTRSLAAANGLSETSNVVLGSTIQIPTVGEAAGALNGTTGPVGQAPGAGASPGAPPPAGSYVV